MWLPLTVGTAMTAAVAVGGYARFIEPRWLRVRRVDVRLGDSLISSRVRLLHLSDFHWSKVVPLSFIERAIQLGLDQNPDLICFTGDLITAGREYDLQQYVPMLRRLAGSAPCFAVLGNHDGGEWTAKHRGYSSTSEIVDVLAEARIHVLTNSSAPTTVAGNRLNLVGTADLWSGEFDAAPAFAGVDRTNSAATLLLAHNPDTKDSVGEYAWDLMLSGHSHGGQIVIPLLGTPLAPVRDKAYVSGLNSWNARWIHTTPGIGNLGGVRLNCRPEVSVLDLT